MRTEHTSIFEFINFIGVFDLLLKINALCFAIFRLAISERLEPFLFPKRSVLPVPVAVRSKA